MRLKRLQRQLSHKEKGSKNRNKARMRVSKIHYRIACIRLGYKAGLHNNHIEIVNRWFPSSKRCSDCGTIKEDLKLDDRTFECNSCGLEIDRDLNSAINLTSTVSSTGFKACGEEGSGSDVTSERNHPL